MSSKRVGPIATIEIVYGALVQNLLTWFNPFNLLKI